VWHTDLPCEGFRETNCKVHAASCQQVADTACRIARTFAKRLSSGSS
jgi:hypothetical protein